jgi:replicative DNA helicase
MTLTARRDEIQRHITGPTAPAAIEAEKALLGIVLGDHEAVDLVEGLQPPHFFEPLHGRIWAEILSRRAGGGYAEPILLDAKFVADESYRAAGGMIWLANLIDLAPGPGRLDAYASEVREAAQRRDLLKLADTLSETVRDGETTATEIIGATESALLSMQAHSRPLTLVTAANASARVLEYLDAPPEAVIGLRTGIDALDDHVGAFLAGDLILIMGRPGMGKSALAGCIALNAALAGRGTIELNGEMSVEEMAQRHLTDIWPTAVVRRMQGPEYRDIRRRRHRPRTSARCCSGPTRSWQPLPLQMLKRAGLKLSQLRSIARRQAAAWARRRPAWRRDHRPRRAAAPRPAAAIATRTRP